MDGFLKIAFRIFGGCVLSFFAYVPGWIAVRVIVQLISDPEKFDWEAIVVLAVSLALFYFIALLAYRAFTGRGRNEDGGLLPPWALKLFAGAFGVTATLIVIFGIYKGK